MVPPEDNQHRWQILLQFDMPQARAQHIPMATDTISLIFRAAVAVSLCGPREQMRQALQCSIMPDVGTFILMCLVLHLVADEGCLLMKAVSQCERRHPTQTLPLSLTLTQVHQKQKLLVAHLVESYGAPTSLFRTPWQLLGNSYLAGKRNIECGMTAYLSQRWRYLIAVGMIMSMSTC